MIEIDGSNGEGGGQVLRSALSLSAATGQAFSIRNIRAKRPRPGLMRQHLTCVKAVEEICNGTAEGAHVGSTELTFEPRDVRAGSYDFSVGTAGSSNLVFQCVLPALLIADGPSNLRLSGGTHNPASPSFEVIADSFLPALLTGNISVAAKLESYGFYPAGGGCWSAEVAPSDLSTEICLESRGALLSTRAGALISNIPYDVAKRELAALQKKLHLEDVDLDVVQCSSPGPGNALVVRLTFEHCQEVFVAFGQRRVSAERVAGRLAQTVRRYLKSEAAVGHQLADQLLVPMALGAGGRFTTVRPSQHFVTNCETIQNFLDVEVRYAEKENGLWLVEVG